MSRGCLDDDVLQGIADSLPNLASRLVVYALSPDEISAAFPRKSVVPEAAVRLQDSLRLFEEGRYALHEALAHRVWYLEKRCPPSAAAAIYFERFYGADTAIRLHAAAEHLAGAILLMLEIDPGAFQKSRKGRKGLQAAVGRFLQVERPGDAVSEAAQRLDGSDDWRRTIEFRNKWVHELVPRMRGLGISYRPGNRWKPSDDEGTWVLSVGGGDEPEFEPGGLIQFLKPALAQFADLLRVSATRYFEILHERGISFTVGGVEVKA
jgi:hypothetical protein